MSPKRACVGCRVRKVRCIPGPTQHCERCTILGFKDCIYEPIKKRGVGKTLRMREACKRCRTRKRGCDAKRPCTRCVNAKSAPECEYEIAGPPLGPFDHLRPSLRDEPDPSDSGDISTPKPWAVGEAILEISAKTPAATITRRAPKSIPPALIRSIGHDRLKSYALPEFRPLGFDGAGTNGPPRVILPPFSVLLSLISPGIPPEPHVTLSLLGAERLQLSDAALGELDMKFRLGALCHLNELGIRFSSEKQQALFRGDTSGTIISPFFVYAAQCLGMHFCEGVDNSASMIRLQATYIQGTLRPFAGIFEGHDWLLRAQAALWIAAGSAIVRTTSLTRAFIQKSCEAVDAAGLQFIPTYGRPPELSEDLHEKLSVLSQIVYFENFLFLTCGGAEPVMTARIEKEFKHKLQEVYPVLFKICPLTMRTQTVLLVRDTVVILNLRPTEEDQLFIWRQSCDQLASLLDNHSQSLLFNLRRFQELGDKSGAGVIRDCCINCFAHLATLCETLCHVDPAPREEVDALCDSALERLSELTQDMRTEGYTGLDLLLGISLKRALEVFNARLANVPIERGAKLRHWKEAIVEVHSDLVVKLPDTEPPIPSLRAALKDRCAKGSRCLKLGVEQQYGTQPE